MHDVGGKVAQDGAQFAQSAELAGQRDVALKAGDREVPDPCLGQPVDQRTRRPAGHGDLHALIAQSAGQFEHIALRPAEVALGHHQEQFFGPPRHICFP